MKKITIFLLTVFLTTFGFSQECLNTSQFGTVDVSTTGIKQISTCQYLGEYSIIYGISAGYEYEFTGEENTSGNLAYITVRSGTSDGAVVGFGPSPLTITAPDDADLYVHWNADDTCATASNCATTTARCITCETIEDCEGVPGGSAIPGSACDDGDATTVNDVYDTDCNCAGVLPTEGSQCSSAIAVVCNADPAIYSSAASNGTNTTTCSMGDNGLWFSFMGTGGNITVNVLADYDVEMSVNSGLCDALTNLDCIDDALANGTETFTVSLSGVGEMYYVYVARFNSGSLTTGNITIDIDCATPPECTAPSLVLAVQDIDGNAITDCLDSGSNYYVLATLSGGEGNTSYNLTANGGDVVEVATDGSVVVGPFAAGTDVDVAAVGVQDEACDVTVSIDSPEVCAATNNDCANAIALTCGESLGGSTIGATETEGITQSCGTFGSQEDVFYTLAVTEGFEYTVAIAGGSDYDGVLAIFTGSCNDLAQIVDACKDATGTGGVESITFTAASTETVVIRTYDYFSSQGSFTISVSCDDGTVDCEDLGLNIGDACDDGDDTTLNDVVTADCNCIGEPATVGSVCESAIAVVCNAGPVTYSSASANGTNTTTCFMGDKGLWFSFVGTGGDITINSTSTFDHEMSINSGVCGSLVNIGCKDGSVGAETYTIASSVDGETYYVYIARYNATSTVTGDITIEIVCATPPACTAPSLALAVQDVDGNAITDCLDSGSDYYVLATLSGGEGNTSYNVAANGGDVVEVAADDSVVLGPFTVGTDVDVTAVGSQDGDCEVSASADSPEICPPANDECANAIALECGDSVEGSTLSATNSGLGSPSCTGGTQNDVFYTLDVIAGSIYTVIVNGANYDGVLVLYSGSCDALTEITCADNGSSAGVEESITFTAATTETVTIRTYDWSSSRGSFTISVECIPLSVDENKTLAGTRLYPNPLNDDTFYVYAPYLNGERIEVTISDVAGRQIFNNTLDCNDNKLTVNVNDILTSGMYFVTLKHANESHTFRLVKE